MASARGMRIDIEGLEGLSHTLGLTAQNLRHAVQDALAGEGGEAMVLEMRRRTPVGKGSFYGHTRDDIRIRDEGRAGVLVGYQGALSHGNKGGGRLQKGAWLESGTKPHIIRARRAKALWFKGHADESVMHPGTRAQKIAQKSMKATKWEVEASIVDHLNTMAEKSGWSGGYVGL